MDESQRSEATGKLHPEHRRTVIVPGSGSFGLDTALTDITYITVPTVPSGRRKQIPWRIVLRFGSPSPRVVVGLDVAADIVFGRGSEGPNSPDIDLSELEAITLGVSRRHALLRPTPNKLFLIDLDSTNGTLLNAVPVGRGMAQALRGGDAISLGGLNFTIEIVREPWQVEREARPVEVETPDVLPVSIPNADLMDADGPTTIHMRPSKPKKAKEEESKKKVEEEGKSSNPPEK